MTNEDGYRKLAVAVIADSIAVLRAAPPPAKLPAPPSGKKGRWVTRADQKVWVPRAEWAQQLRNRWRLEWEVWEAGRIRECAFWRNVRASSMWCAAAGLDRDAVYAKLYHGGLLYDSKSRFPVNMKGESLLYG